MEGLFKIVKIDGKGLGWIALHEIKASTLIYKEKPQFVTPSDSDSSVSASDLMMSFYAMTENDQKEFLELHNRYLDLNSLDDFDKKWYFDCKNTIEGIEGETEDTKCCDKRSVNVNKHRFFSSISLVRMSYEII